MFTKENTTGYTQNELDALNAEWAERVADRDLEPGTDEYYEEEKSFADEVSRRTMSRTIKTGEKAQLRIDNGLHEVAYTVMTASGPAQKIRLFDDLESADQFFQEREAGTMPTNGYELHTAADL